MYGRPPNTEYPPPISMYRMRDIVVDFRIRLREQPLKISNGTRYHVVYFAPGKTREPKFWELSSGKVLGK